MVGSGEPPAPDPRRALRAVRICARGSAPPRARPALRATPSLAATTSAGGVAVAATDAPAPLVYVAGTSAGWMITLVRPTHASLLPRLAPPPEELIERLRRQRCHRERERPGRSAPRRWADGSDAGVRCRAPVSSTPCWRVLLRSAPCASRHQDVRTDPAHDGEPTRARVVVAEAVVGVRAVTRRPPFAAPGLDDGSRARPARVRRCPDRRPRVRGPRDGRCRRRFPHRVDRDRLDVLGATVATGLAPRGAASTLFRWGSAMSGLSSLGIATQPALSAVFPGDERRRMDGRRRERADHAAATDPGQAPVARVRRA